jgi:hypothetical protein
LVKVGVAREHGVGPEAGGARRRLDVVGDVGRSSVLGVDGNRRLVVGGDHRTLTGLSRSCEPLQVGGQKVHLLVVGEHRIRDAASSIPRSLGAPRASASSW